MLKTWEWWFFGIMLLLVGAILGWGFSSEIYYHRGIQNAKVYYETTGAWPTADWVKAAEQKTYKYPEQVRESLKPFTLTK